MRRHLIFTVFACILIIPYGVQAQRAACGGDTPHWLLVTVLAEADDGPLTEKLTLTKLPTGIPVFLKVCDIDGVAVHPDGRETLIDLKSNERHFVVKETAAHICAVLPTCSDATRQARSR